QMPQHPYLGMHALVVPTFSIDAVRTKHLQIAALDLRRQYTDHSAILILEKLPHGGRKHEQRCPRMPEDQGFHLPAQFLAVSLVKFAIHSQTVPADEVSYLKGNPTSPILRSTCRFLPAK